MKSEKISSIHKKFPDQWLLIAVDKTDPLTHTAVSGRTLAHSPSRDVIYKKLITVKTRRPTLVDFARSGRTKNIAVIFPAHA